MLPFGLCSFESSSAYHIRYRQQHHNAPFLEYYKKKMERSYQKSKTLVAQHCYTWKFQEHQAKT